MTISTAQRSFRMTTRRDLISFTVTLGFVASFPLLVYFIAQNDYPDQTAQAIDLSAGGRLVQIIQDKPVQIASVKTGE